VREFVGQASSLPSAKSFWQGNIFDRLGWPDLAGWKPAPRFGPLVRENAPSGATNPDTPFSTRPVEEGGSPELKQAMQVPASRQSPRGLRTLRDRWRRVAREWCAGRATAGPVGRDGVPLGPTFRPSPLWGERERRCCAGWWTCQASLMVAHQGGLVAAASRRGSSAGGADTQERTGPRAPATRSRCEPRGCPHRDRR